MAPLQPSQPKDDDATPAPDDAPPPARMPWADLLARVYKADVLKCERCGGPMTMLAFTTGRDVLLRIRGPSGAALDRAARPKGYPQCESQHLCFFCSRRLLAISMSFRPGSTPMIRSGLACPSKTLE